MANRSSRRHRPVNVDVVLDHRNLFRGLFQGIGGEVCKGLSEQVAERGIEPFDRELDPSTYSCSDSFRRDYLGALVFSKYDDGKSSEIKKTKALEKFQLAEQLCRSTNERLASYRVVGPLVKGLTPDAVIFTAAGKIRRLLGTLDLDEVARGFGWGPGATTRLPRTRSDAFYKFSGIPESTTNNAVFADAVFQHLALWKESLDLPSESSTLWKHSVGNRIVTVPKNAQIDRVIAIEPDLNMFVQKGFGAVIRSRLKKVGVDLDDQSLNQRLARDGSIGDDLSTLDLSMASDTVSSEIVRQLMPPDWYNALEMCRSQSGVLPSGELILYRKFSSMGNGFTFELESLIFWALCSSVAMLLNEMDHRIAIYGDDIIVPVGIVDGVIGALTYAGFKVNERKSFSSGPFRESCGKHFFRGNDVTPFFVRSLPRSLSDVFLLHNNVMRWSASDGLHGFRDSGCDRKVLHFCESLKQSVPENWRKPRIPDGYGDGAFIGSFDEVTPTRADQGWCCWRSKVLYEPRLLADKQGTGRLLKALYGLERNGSSGDSCSDISRVRFGRCLPRSETLSRQVARYRILGRKLVAFPSAELKAFFKRADSSSKVVNQVPKSKRARIGKILVRQWDDLGPWI